MGLLDGLTRQLDLMIDALGDRRPPYRHGVALDGFEATTAGAASTSDSSTRMGPDVDP
jgi:hypothetical protein